MYYPKRGDLWVKDLNKEEYNENILLHINKQNVPVSVLCYFKVSQVVPLPVLWIKTNIEYLCEPTLTPCVMNETFHQNYF